MRQRRRWLVATVALAGVLWLGAAVVKEPERQVLAGVFHLPGAKQASPEILNTLSRSCQDCHSDHTRYPWYANVPPLSWMVQNDVERGRAKLNFSRWDKYSKAEKMARLAAIRTEVKDGTMPFPAYTTLHSEAKLSERDVQLLRDWAKAELRGLSKSGAVN